MLGFEVAQSTVSKYMARPPKPPSQTWKTFLQNHTEAIAGRPKAVGIEHRNLITLTSGGRSVVSDAELRGLLFSTSLNFDLSAFEMFLPLAFGGCVVLVENLLTLRSAPRREKVCLINT